MEAISIRKEENYNYLGKKCIKFSTFRNGLLANLIRNYFEPKSDFYSSFTCNEILSLIFMFLLLIRVVRGLTFSYVDTRIFIYYGIPWHYLGGNHYHIEIMFLLWTLNYLVLYLYVIHSPTEHYKWLEIYEFLAGIIPRQRIGSYS